MRRWAIACSAAMLALGLAATAHADEWNKLTYLTFSGPVQMPGITLPAGTYRFELADPNSGRRVIRVSDKDGSKSYGIFLSISDQKLQPSDNPVVMFKETPAGAPQAVQAWFYPGETYGYEFAYPHDQALKIAKATHTSVLSVKDTPQASTDDERIASMKSAETTHIDENDKAVSTDEQLKDSSSLHPSNTTTASNAAATTAAGSSSPMANQTSSTATTAGASRPAQSNTAQSNTAQSNTAQSNTARPNPAQSNTAQSNTRTPQSNTASRSNTAGSNRAVGTSGTQAGAASDTAQSNNNTGSRRSLPRTAGELPLIELLSGLAFAGGLGVRAFRRR